MLCGLAVASISYMHHILASKKLFISTIIYDTQIYGQQHLFLYNVMQSRTGLHFLYNTHHIASEKLFISTIIYDMKYKYEALDHGRYGASATAYDITNFNGWPNPQATRRRCLYQPLPRDPAYFPKRRQFPHCTQSQLL